MPSILLMTNLPQLEDWTRLFVVKIPSHRYFRNLYLSVNLEHA